MTEDPRQEGGGLPGWGDMRRVALVIGCGDLALDARIASDRFEGVGFGSVFILEFSRVAIGQMSERHGCGRAGRRDDSENGSSS